MSSPTASSPSWRSLPGLAPLKTRRPSAHLRRPETAAELEYVSVGCNRSVHAADWCQEDGPGGGLLAYGAHNTVAISKLYEPRSARHKDQASRPTSLRAVEHLISPSHQTSSPSMR